MTDRRGEVDLLVDVLSHPAGFDVGIFGLLAIRTTDQETVEVEWVAVRGRRAGHRSFPIGKLRAAVQLFVRLRRAHRLGADIERKLYAGSGGTENP